MKKIISLVLCLLMLFSLAACGGDEPTPEAPVATPEPTPEADPVEEALESYDAALAGLLAADGLTAALTIETVRSIKSLSYTETVQEALKYQGLQSDSPIIVRDQTTDAFNTELAHEYVFSGGKVIIDETYSVAMSAADYLESLYPLQLIDASLYGTVELDGSTLSFSDASAAESWLGGDIDLVSAEASAVLSGEEIDSLSYSAVYSQNAVDVKLDVTLDIVSFDAGPDLRASVPTASELVELSDLRIVDMFDRALYAPSGIEALVGSNYTVYTLVAGALSVSESGALSTYGSGDSLQMKYEFSQQVAENGQVYDWSSTETYSDGVYRVEADGELSEEQLSADELDPGYLLTEYVLPPDLLSDISLSTVNGYYFLEFSGGENLGEILQSVICGYLYGDETLLDSLADAYATDSLSGWLSLNPDTMLPVGYGLEYLGHHTIDGMDYPIGLTNNVNLQLLSDSAYKELTGETLPDAQPENKATPLFYKVSGEDGQEMWLLGTIHVGDERTAYLPDSVYAALEGSDALAVEVDVNRLEEQLSDDPDLAAQYAAAMMYADVSTIASHIDPELYESARRLLKASGAYVYSHEYMTPAAWSISIEDYHLFNSRLHIDKGVDARLIAIAEEKGIEIREVEALDAQLKALFGGSEELQAYLLESTVSTDMQEYNRQVAELYELWCAGDEAALAEAINSEADELTEEELPLYEEYAKAMYTDRNANMHETAVEYLESGETVFYAVGLAHLLGMDGLVDSLRAAGYTVEPLA